MKNVFLIIVFLFSTSCGKDQLNSKISSTTTKLSGTSCSCSTGHSPVCGADGKDYDNSCLANCFTTVAHPGHCYCASNSIPVCGSDGKDYSECEAIASNSGISITKYVPCASSEL